MGLQRWVLELAKEGNMDAVREYLEAGGDPTIRDEEGKTLLYYAYKRYWERLGDLVKACLQRGMDPNERLEDGFTLLHFAAASADPEAVELALRPEPTPT